MAKIATRNWLTYAEAAEHIGVTERQLRRWVTEGRVPFTRLGGRTRFDANRLDAWVERQSFEPDGDAA